MASSWFRASLTLASLLLASAPAAAEDAPDQKKTGAPPATAAPSPGRDWSERPDFAALRAEFGARDDFAQRCELRPVREGFEHLGGERWSELVALTGRWAEACPVDIDAHVLRAIALDHSGRADEGDHHRSWARGLFESVLASGDGKTPETAYQVIAVFEEYSMLRLFGYEVKGQALTRGGIDAISVVADGDPRTVFFDPAVSFMRLEKQLRESSAPE
jgi:hypothetical protein